MSRALENFITSPSVQQAMAAEVARHQARRANPRPRPMLGMPGTPYAGEQQARPNPMAAPATRAAPPSLPPPTPTPTPTPTPHPIPPVGQPVPIPLPAAPGQPAPSFSGRPAPTGAQDPYNHPHAPCPQGFAWTWNPAFKAWFCRNLKAGTPLGPTRVSAPHNTPPPAQPAPQLAAAPAAPNPWANRRRNRWMPKY